MIGQAQPKTRQAKQSTLTEVFAMAKQHQQQIDAKHKKSKFQYISGREARQLSDAKLQSVVDREQCPRPSGFPRFSPASLEMTARNVKRARQP
jgi:hypothetical protein